jgi:hypothetical protein
VNYRSRNHYFFFTLFIAVLMGIVFSVGAVPPAHAAQLNWVSDTITDSRPSVAADHTIVFGVPSGIPASGKITIAFEGMPFSLDPSFGIGDMNLSVSTGSPYGGFISRTLGPVPSSTADGAALTQGTGPIVFTLGTSIVPGSYVRILLGTNAPSGTYQIANPSAPGSYRILINTTDGSGATLDYGAAMVAILPAVGVTTNTNVTTPPVIYNGMPSGMIPYNVSGVLISFNTNTYATCRYATSPGIPYSLMTGTTTADSLGVFHTFVVSGITNGTTYDYYVRCDDFAGNMNPTDYLVSFSGGEPTGSGTGGGSFPTSTTSGSSSTGSTSNTGGGGGGGGAPYPPALASPMLVITGVAVPNQNMAILEDGTKLSLSTTADGAGNFSFSIISVSQGTHSFTVQGLDGSGNPASSYTATITLVSATQNSITGIVLPPSLSFATGTIALNKSFTISGFSEPSSTVDVHVASQNGVTAPFDATTTANRGGVWSYTLSAAGLPADTYQIKARSFVAGLAVSSFSTISYLGVGEAPSPRLIGDLNGDGKVNLIDFSILLAHWGQAWPRGDLNGNGIVDLPDLSILLFYWTG